MKKIFAKRTIAQCDKIIAQLEQKITQLEGKLKLSDEMNSITFGKWFHADGELTKQIAKSKRQQHLIDVLTTTLTIYMHMYGCEMGDIKDGDRVQYTINDKAFNPDITRAILEAQDYIRRTENEQQTAIRNIAKE